MGKNILQRLFGFLWDPSEPGKANPSSGDDPGDNGRPRLTVIEGGKGNGEWDGNERRKIPAVIGIPYSSDAADDTVEKEEESVMKHIAKYMFVTAAVAAAVFALSACGGGGGSTVQGSSPGISAGTMTKGSVIVNGVKFTAAAVKTIRVDDNPNATELELRDGMEVKVKGRINDDRITGQFEKVEAEPRVRGQMTGKGADDFTVHNHHVITDDNTVFEDRVAGVFSKLNNGINDLADLNEVEVHGGLDDLGNVRASRVERRDDNPTDEVRGVVTAITAPGTTIHIGAFSIDIAGVPTSPAGQTVNVGDLVEVHMNAAGTVATLVDIEDLEDAEFEPAQNENFELEGFVSNLAGSDPSFTFKLGTTNVTTSASTKFLNGTGADLVNGTKVEAEGAFDNTTNTIAATKVAFKRTKIVLEGIVSADNTSSISLLGLTVAKKSFTQSVAVTPGSKFKVIGFEDNAGNLVAERIANGSGGPNSSVQGHATAKTGSSVTVLGITANQVVGGPQPTVFSDDRGSGNVPISAATFFGAVTPKSATEAGTLVKVRGPVTGSAMNAEEMDLED